MTQEVVCVPDDAKDWACVNLVVGVPSMRIFTVTDGRKVLEGMTPSPKPPGGARDDGVDATPEDTKNRETYEEVGIVVQPGQSKLVRRKWRHTHWLFGYVTFVPDVQFDSERREYGMEGEVVDIMTAEQILQSTRDEFVPLYRDFFRPELDMIVSGALLVA